MKKYLLSLGVIAAATLSLTSCLGSGKNETNYDFTYSDCFNYVVDRQENTVYIGHSPIYKFVFHNDLALDMDITNLKLNADQTLNLRFPTMSTQISSTDGFTIFTAYNVLPVGAGASYEFDTIKFRGYPWRSPAIYDLTYTVNDRYDVTVYPTVLGYYAQATVTNKTEGATDPVFTGKDLEVGTYMITINSEKMTASLFVMEGKFEKNSYDTERLEVRNLPVTIIDGGFRIVTEPGVTYPVYDYQQASSASALTDYSMSDISLTAYLSTGASLSYNCTLGKNNQGYPKNYNVSTTLRYFPFSAETQQ
ncbi:MAG: hypothetical protein K2J28_04625 [Duncaniella sp.]|nr:hypothetical protein [Duncaniella sp.]MDE6813104.1 hypothetical protein [Duncaniella sp.]